MAQRTWEPPEDCQSCGRCCFSDNPEHVRVFGVDFDRMGDRARSHTVFIGNRCFMKMHEGRCSALGVDATTGRFGCTIYEERSDVCRSLERGTGACRAEFEAKAGRPDVLLTALRKGHSDV